VDVLPGEEGLRLLDVYDELLHDASLFVVDALFGDKRRRVGYVRASEC